MPDKPNPAATIEDLKPFWGKITYYDKKFASHIQSSKLLFFSWNWAAFLVPHLWLVYRKMYWEFFLSYFFLQYIPIILVTSGANLCASYFGAHTFETSSVFLLVLGPLSIFSLFSMGVLFGCLGNSLYLRKIKKRFIKHSHKNGVSKIGVCLVAAMNIAFFAISMSQGE